MKKLDERLDQAFELIMRGMEVIGNIVGDPPNEKKVNPKTDQLKYDHPTTFAMSLQENSDKRGRMKC